MIRSAGVDGRANGGRLSTSGGVRPEVGGCLAGVSAARRSCDRADVSGFPGTRKVFSTSWGREITAFDDFRSTVTMVARSALPGSESVSESIAI